MSMTMLGRFCCCASAGTLVTVIAATPAIRPRHNECPNFIGAYSDLDFPSERELSRRRNLGLCYFGRSERFAKISLQRRPSTTTTFTFDPSSCVDLIVHL